MRRQHLNMEHLDAECLRHLREAKFSFRRVIVPPIAPALPIGRSGDLGTLPFFLQLAQIADLPVFVKWGLRCKAQWRCRQLTYLAQRGCHFPRLPEHGCRFVRLVMKQRAQRKQSRSRPSRRYDDADTRPSLGDTTGQVRSAHRARHAYVCEKQPNVRVFFEQSQGLVGVPGFEHPVTGIQEHTGRAHPLKHIVIDDDHNEGSGGDLGHLLQQSLIIIVPYSSMVRKS
jgi:hypothetical protein